MVAPKENGFPIKSGMTKRREPRWVVPFLRALERTGEVRGAAGDAGIDHTTAYGRRRAHAEFGAAWDAAIVAHSERVKAEEQAEIGALRNGPPPSALRGATSPAKAGEDVVAAGGKVRRAGHDRWSRRKEAVFFDELAATANVQMAADAAGVSTSAVFARRLKQPLFRAKWEAVVRNAKASIDLYLVEETKKSFEPGTLETGNVAPRVTIDQAIKISQLNALKTKREEADPFVDDSAPLNEDVEEIKERIIGKLRRLREHDRRGQLEAGWSFDESYDLMIPPGYVRGPDYVPKPPEEPIDFDSRYR